MTESSSLSLNIWINGPRNADGNYQVYVATSDSASGEGTLNLGMEVEAWNLAASSQPYEQGKALQERLFASKEVNKVFDQAQERARVESGDRLNIVLRIRQNASELHALNWEYLPLTRDEHTPFTRFPDLPVPANPPLVARPLKMAVAIASPIDLTQKGLADIPVGKAIQTIVDAVEKPVADGVLEVTLLPGQKGLDELDADLRAKLENPNSGWKIVQDCTTIAQVLSLMDDCHLFHFLGHGGFKDGVAKLYLETTTGTTDDAVTDTLLCRRLKGAARKPYLIFLSACESAKRDAETDQAFMGLGPKLIECGIPTVVAMQKVVELFPMLALSKLFYEKLLEEGMVNVALNSARRLLYDEKSAIWAPPVLFGRLLEDGGRIFKALRPVNDAAQATSEIVSTLNKGEPKSKQIRAKLLKLIKELSKTHQTIVDRVGQLRQIKENEATFANDFRTVYNNWRTFYDSNRFKVERTSCGKVGNIKFQLEKDHAPITQTPEWDLLRRNLDSLSSYDNDVIEEHYVPFMKRFDDVMVKIDQHVRGQEIKQAMTLVHVFLDGLGPQYEEIKEKLTLMDKTIEDIELSL